MLKIYFAGYDIFPKMLGVFERAWKVENGHVSTYSLLPAAEVTVTKDGERVYARTSYGSQESVRTSIIQ